MDYVRAKVCVYCLILCLSHNDLRQISGHTSLHQGFSVAWWKNKHNLHHSVPNVHGPEDKGDLNGDPDINTMPLLAWSPVMGEQVQPGGKHHSKLGRFMIRYQAILYFPILFLARLSWVLSSLSVVLSAMQRRDDATPKKRHGTSHLVRRLGLGLEFFGLLSHYIVYGTLVAKVASVHGGLWAFGFVFLSQTVSGLLLGKSGLEMNRCMLHICQYMNIMFVTSPA